MKQQHAILQFLICTWFVVAAIAATSEMRAVSIGQDGRLVYQTDEYGNRVPDFSACGYRHGEEAIPDVPVRIVVIPINGDDGARIQSAIDYVSELPGSADGFRGTVLLEQGHYTVSGALEIAASGVVLRGSGMGPDGTEIKATGLDRRALIRIAGIADRTPLDEPPRRVLDAYVPVGTTQLRIDRVDGLTVGDTVWITRPSTEEWIQALGMTRLGTSWKPGTRDIRWDRTITAIEGDVITLDVPMTTAIDERYGAGLVVRYAWPGRIEHIGVENLSLESEFDADNIKDEDHAWTGIAMEYARDAWVRQVAFRHFAGSAVVLWESTSRVTVHDCKSLKPISEIGGYRRQTFFTMGQMTLFLRCWSEHGLHDFSVGHCAAGPNAFVACTASEALGDSGPLESWASGVLYDNVRVDGARLNLENRWVANSGAGWSAANSVLWQCSAAEMRCFSPPTAQNWAVGVWSSFIGDAHWQARSDFARPRSLYLAQLAERLGPHAAKWMEPILHHPPGSTSPTYVQAAKMVANSDRPAPQVLDLIDGAAQREPIPVDAADAPTLEQVQLKHPDFISKPPEAIPTKPLELSNGWLVMDGRLKTGSRTGIVWWRGNVRPTEAPTFGRAITRFVPGRIGTGYTDDLGEVTDWMASANIAVMDYHHALWYERRRDDHQRVRRADGDVWPPFYEMPFARSGVGIAWDGLSQYDLSSPNPWYWSRLANFADLCDQKGLVLNHQQYFQHNIIEAGAHWADYPWRSANNINESGFPEPPPYAGDKRIFQAHLFYDVDHPTRRALHCAYIRQCLEQFADNSNVIQMTSGEYTGPLEFMQFWIDTVVEWERETGNDVQVGLSCTRDVQDAILADPVRGPAVSVIDIRYWMYQADGRLYAPKGGKSLAPRQHARQLKPQSSSFRSTARAVQEYRLKYPHKAVLYNADQFHSGGRDGWAVLMGGGSLADLPNLDDRLRSVIPRMRPVPEVNRDERQLCLAETSVNYLVHAAHGSPIILDLTHAEGTFTAHWIDHRTGQVVGTSSILGGGVTSLQRNNTRPAVVWLTREY